MEDLDAQLRHATGGRLSYDARAGELRLRAAAGEARAGDPADPADLVVRVGKEAVRNAMQSALLAAESPSVPDGALAAGARALLAAYDREPAVAERLLRRSAAQFEGTAAARRRRRG
ncbi:hypothetical protein [Nocardioides deserti]|uniref:YbaB/EbfC family DNA-binding protein n=1 Tax=Nocardioides deserti TaxID=1588644 RepID=A0ABR6U4F0_9ACTN|nr:hypothetical protein [Nocardioides deserti]MBC2959311.1 hypothetical protein [Nocardioides deserti]GGO68072.1 hypothetical protein GCM10012276_01030 [Nocardioides deserti]